jgi:glucose-6-phosphate 1-dehydrogenase
MVFQRPPHLPFAGKLARDLRRDSLTLRIQPDDGISLAFGAKVPGPTFTISNVAMDFSYSEQFPGQTVDAYDRLLLDAMVGDPMLFIRDDEVQRAWTILRPLQGAFAEGEPRLTTYEAGTWGPEEADRLIGTVERHWRNSE